MVILLFPPPLHKKETLQLRAWATYSGGWQTTVLAVVDVPTAARPPHAVSDRGRVAAVLS